MNGCSLVSKSATEIVVRHDHTGHEFTFRVEGDDLLLGPVKEGAGPKDPGDVAADAHAFARAESKRTGTP